MIESESVSEREREIGEICCSNSANYIFYTYALALSTFRLHQGLVNTDMVVHAILDSGKF